MDLSSRNPWTTNQYKLGDYIPVELACLWSPPLATRHWTWIKSMLHDIHCTLDVKE